MISTPKPNCPKCGSQHTVKKGTIHNKKPKHKCQGCGKQFVDNHTKKVISQETRDLVDRLLIEKIPLAGIARAASVSKKWLQDYVNNKYAQTSHQINVSDKIKAKLEIECNETWSFVGNKGNKQWIWLALDKKTKEIIGVYIGARSKEGAKGLWNSLPALYRQCAVCYTDFWASYEKVLQKKRHRAVGKESGKTNHIERFNNTMRQRISRLVRKTLSFYKKLENHFGAIWYFVHHYNACLSV